MLTRRSFFRFLTRLTGGAGVAAVAPAADQGMEAPPPLGSHAALITVPALWFFDEATQKFWHADDIFQWMDWNLPQAVIDRARQGLDENIGPVQLMRLLRRRRWHQLIEIALPPGSHSETDNLAPACARVTVRHWSEHPGTVRPFFRAFGLGQPHIEVAITNLTTGSTSWTNGADYVGGLTNPT